LDGVVGSCTPYTTHKVTIDQIQLTWFGVSSQAIVGPTRGNKSHLEKNGEMSSTRPTTKRNNLTC
jgi:hypothetical protein